MDELELVKINDDQRAVLVAALDNDGLATGDGRMLAALRRRGLLAGTKDGVDYITDAGRRQIRWYADDCARQWGIETNTWHQYVKRGTAPQPNGRGTFGSSTDRPWWDPSTVLEFERPTSAHRRGMRTSALRDMSEVDAVTIVRAYRGGTSARALAAQHGVAPTTLIAWLEERGEKRETTATRAERDRRMSANNPTEVPR